MTNEESNKSRESFLLSVSETEKVYDTDVRTGLSDAQAAVRQQTYGKNKMAEGKRKSLLRMFLEQFKDFLILVLVAAAVISGFLGEISDAILILIIVILNAVIGMVQENKAEIIKKTFHHTPPVFRLRVIHLYHPIFQAPQHNLLVPVLYGCLQHGVIAEFKVKHLHRIRHVQAEQPVKGGIIRLFYHLEIPVYIAFRAD